MKAWNPDDSPAPVFGVPEGCRAVRVVTLVDRDGEQIEQRDRRGRTKTTEVALVRDTSYPKPNVDELLLRFARGAKDRRWTTVESRYGEDAFALALQLVRAGESDLICDIESRGHVGSPRKLVRTAAGTDAETAARAIQRNDQKARAEIRLGLADLVAPSHPSVARALQLPNMSPEAHAVLIAAAHDLIGGIQHAGPRAFAQFHFGDTKRHDVRDVLRSAGVDDDVFEVLGLRRGDRIGLGGPIALTLQNGEVDLSPLRGPVQLRLDQPHLIAHTGAPLVLVIENLQSAEVVCMKHPDLPVVYTAGQFDDAVALLLAQLCADRRAVAITDADLGGIRIAQRVVEAVPHAEIVDVGEWPHTRGALIAVDGPAAQQLDQLMQHPLVGPFACSVRQRGYRVEQEQSSLKIVERLRTEPNEAGRGL